MVDKYLSLSFANPPPLYFDFAPAKTAAGVALVPPYVILKDDGITPDFTLELVPLEVCRVRFLVFALTLAAADAAATGIKYAQGTQTQRQGFDFADTLPLTGHTALDHGCVRTREVRSRTADPLSGAAVWLVELSYTITYRVGTTP